MIFSHCLGSSAMILSKDPGCRISVRSVASAEGPVACVDVLCRSLVLMATSFLGLLPFPGLFVHFICRSWLSALVGTVPVVYAYAWLFSFNSTLSRCGMMLGCRWDPRFLAGRMAHCVPACASLCLGSLVTVGSYETSLRVLSLAMDCRCDHTVKH